MGINLRRNVGDIADSVYFLYAQLNKCKDEATHLAIDFWPEVELLSFYD